MHTFWVTFYSYKGGVGRSMALANTAALLAKKGRRVLMIDFDLEAPGLDTFDEFTTPNGNPGLVEYVSNYRKTGKAAPVRNYIHEIKADALRDGNLWLMTSGKKDASYNQNRTAINWTEFYRSEAGGLFFENFKADIEETYQPDYVFIDSRTGLTDVGGVCTAHLPNLVVLLFSLNEQNLRGIASVAKVLQESDNAPQMIPVATPVPNLPRDARSLIDDRYLRAKELLGIDIKLSINYAPQISLREKIYTWGASNPLVIQYESLCESIRTANPAGIDYLIRKADEAVHNFDIDSAEDIQLSLSQDYSKHAAAWRAIAELKRMQADLDGYEAALRKALEVNPADRVSYDRINHLLVNKKRTDDLIALARSLLDQSDKLTGAEADSIKHNLGCLLMKKAQYAEAYDYFRQNLDFHIQQGHSAPSEEGMLAAQFNTLEAARRAKIRVNLSWLGVIKTYESLSKGIGSGSPTSRLNRLQAMHIAYACSGNISKARATLHDANKLLQQIPSKERLFRVSIYDYGSLETFLEDNSKMLDSLGKEELWDGTKLKTGQD